MGKYQGISIQGLWAPVWADFYSSSSFAFVSILEVKYSLRRVLSDATLKLCTTSEEGVKVIGRGHHDPNTVYTDNDAISRR